MPINFSGVRILYHLCDIVVTSAGDDLEEVADTLYNFFVYQRRSNTECFLETYIDENMRSIIEQFFPLRPISLSTNPSLVVLLIFYLPLIPKLTLSVFLISDA